MNTFPVERVRTAAGPAFDRGQKVALSDLRLPRSRQAKFIIGIRPKNMWSDTRTPGVRQQPRAYLRGARRFHPRLPHAGAGDLVFKVGDAGLRLELDQAVSFSFEPEKVLFYDTETTMRIRPGH